MFKYNCLNAISEAGLKSLSSDFVKTDDVNEAEAILVRSAAMHDMEFSDNLLAIARAGAGVNNIPLDKCAEKGIVVFNTPGANANGVKELVIAAMILTSRNLIAANGWVNENKDDENIGKTMEKAKSKFAGREVKGKKLGVIGLGAIGVLVANAASSLGMEVIGCDPFLRCLTRFKFLIETSKAQIIHKCTSVFPSFERCDDPADHPSRTKRQHSLMTGSHNDNSRKAFRIHRQILSQQE